MYFRYTRVWGPCVVLQNKIKIEKKKRVFQAQRGFKGHLVEHFLHMNDDLRTSQTNTHKCCKMNRLRQVCRCWIWVDTQQQQPSV